MVTQCPISTISFNTKEFLISTLNLLNVDFWFFVKHYPEVDETKEHFHLYIEPSRRTDTESIRKALQEFVVGSEVPLGCLPFRKSKFDDASLYFLHDKDYLASKFQSRKYHYTFDDIVTNSFDYFLEYYNQIDRKKICGNAQFVTFAEQRIPFCDIVAQGFVPIQQIKQYQTFYDCLICSIARKSDKVYRDHYEEFKSISFVDLPPLPK